jgi:hypothetical protein
MIQQESNAREELVMVASQCGVLIFGMVFGFLLAVTFGLF